jgi:hypothetical protein
MYINTLQGGVAKHSNECAESTIGYSPLARIYLMLLFLIIVIVKYFAAANLKTIFGIKKFIFII